VRRAISELAAIDAASPLDRILLPGDITDAGTRAEWLEFSGLIRDYPGLCDRMLFVPGNHDVNVIDRTNPGRLDLPNSAAQALRKLRVVLALDELQGECVRVVDRASGTLGPSLSDYLRQGERPSLLRALAERGTRRGRHEMTRVWDAIFPLVAPAPEYGGYGVILLDSNALRHFSLTNAIGVVGRSQLRALRSVLRSAPDRAWMIALHHAVVEYPVASIDLHERIGLALANAPDVLAAIASHGAPVVVLHGHRHRDWIGTRGTVTVCSAPSVTLGSYNTDATHGCFHVYELARGADGALRLTTTEQKTIA
jgi:3',5'-cyclic AMP phosphodiesterase CpdA